MARHWSVAQLAARLGVHDTLVTRWEAGHVRPWPHFLRRLALLFDLPYADLAALAEYPVDEPA
jgi:transcriptional regulator with XRE-family HTH domain